MFTTCFLILYGYLESLCLVTLAHPHLQLKLSPVEERELFKDVEEMIRYLHCFKIFPQQKLERIESC